MSSVEEVFVKLNFALNSTEIVGDTSFDLIQVVKETAVTLRVASNRLELNLMLPASML